PTRRSSWSARAASTSLTVASRSWAARSAREARHRDDKYATGSRQLLRAAVGPNIRREEVGGQDHTVGDPAQPVDVLTGLELGLGDLEPRRPGLVEVVAHLDLRAPLEQLLLSHWRPPWHGRPPRGQRRSWKV